MMKFVNIENGLFQFSNSDGVEDVLNFYSIEDVKKYVFIYKLEFLKSKNLLDLSYFRDFQSYLPEYFIYDSKLSNSLELNEIKLKNYYSTWSELLDAVLCRILRSNYKNKSLNIFIFLNSPINDNIYYKNLFYSLDKFFKNRLKKESRFYFSYAENGDIKVRYYRKFDYVVRNYMRYKSIDEYSNLSDFSIKFLNSSYFRKVDLIFILYKNDLNFILDESNKSDFYIFRKILRKVVFLNMSADNKNKVLSSNLYKQIYPPFRFNIVFSKLYKIFS